MRLAQIQDNKVINVIEADSVWSSNGADSYMPSDTAGIGWELVDGVLTAPVIIPLSPVKAIEDHVSKFYTPMQQTMMKIWWDALPRESVPKLSAIYSWLMGLTLLADTGDYVAFTDAPSDINDVYAECTAVVKAAAAVTPAP